jgi:hypothetical protein
VGKGMIHALPDKVLDLTGQGRAQGPFHGNAAQGNGKGGFLFPPLSEIGLHLKAQGGIDKPALVDDHAEIRLFFNHGRHDAVKRHGEKGNCFSGKKIVHIKPEQEAGRGLHAGNRNDGLFVILQGPARKGNQKGTAAQAQGGTGPEQGIGLRKPAKGGKGELGDIMNSFFCPLVQSFHILKHNVKRITAKIDQLPGHGLEDKGIVGTGGIGQAIGMLFIHRKFLSDFFSEGNFDLKLFLTQAMGTLIGELLDSSKFKSGLSDIFKVSGFYKNWKMTVKCISNILE